MRNPPSNLVDFAYHDLEEKIVNSTFKANEKLVISTLAKNYGISTIPIREALAKLSTVGIVDFTPNQGYMVSPHLDKSAFIELFQARLMLDLAAVPGVLDKVTPADIKELKAINKQTTSSAYSTRTYKQFKRFMDLNSRFHRRFLEIGRNRFFEKLYDDLDIEKFISRHILKSGINFDGLIHGHEDIVSALENGNASKLRKALIEHLTDGINLIFGYTEDIVIWPLK